MEMLGQNSGDWVHIPTWGCLDRMGVESRPAGHLGSGSGLALSSMMWWKLWGSLRTGCD